MRRMDAVSSMKLPIFFYICRGSNGRPVCEAPAATLFLCGLMTPEGLGKLKPLKQQNCVKTSVTASVANVFKD